MVGLIGGFLGFCVVAIILKAVASGVVAIFVCFSEDPAAGKQNRPESYNRLVDSGNETIYEIVRAEGLDSTSPQTNFTQAPQQQQQVYAQAPPQYAQQAQPQYAQQAQPQYQNQYPR